MFSAVSREDPRRRWSCSPAGSPKKNAALGKYRRKESSASEDTESFFCTYAWYESWLNRLAREFIKTSTFKIIVAAIFLHSAISIVLIYAHLLYYSDTYLRLVRIITAISGIKSLFFPFL